MTKDKKSLTISMSIRFQFFFVTVLFMVSLGCWCCTMVKEDKSLQNFINKSSENDARILTALRDYRNWLLELRQDKRYRDSKRRNGTVYKKADGTFGLGPFTLEARQIILERLLLLEEETGLNLITDEELKAIDRMWDEEGDLTCRRLVNTYFEVKGNKLPWDEYKIPRFDEESIEIINSISKKHNLPVELISKLILSVDRNKNITRNTKMQKTFDQIIGQGWLHYDAVEGALENED